MPGKHLWLSVPSVIFDMLRIYWEGRTVNQTTITQCPSVKAKGQKVHEKIIYAIIPHLSCTHLHCFLHVSVYVRYAAVRDTL